MDPVRRAVVRLLALVTALGLMTALVACGDDSSPGGSGTTDQAEVERGGTLNIGMTDDPSVDPRNPGYMQQHHWALLNRTLYTYPLTPVEDGGGDPVPDLAEGPAEVSEDGLTYTVRIKRGLRYAPPFADREITTPDLVGVLEHLADPRFETVNAGLYSTIEGIDPATGKMERGADSISGVSTPDDYTIVFRLREEKGDFLHLLAFPSLTPTPPGVMDAHGEDYARYVVSTGPYMVKGADAQSTENAKPLSGYVPGRSLSLVRNPSWDRATDDVRQANPDAIEFTFGDTDSSIARKVTNGELDLMYVAQAPPDILRQYQTDPNLRDRLHVNPKVSVRIATLNVGVKPLDDVHVRRAINFIVSREDVRRADGGEATGELAYHRFAPNTIGGELTDYDEYASASPEEALEKALEEMKQSKYETDAEGKCTDPVCDGLRIVPSNPDRPETNIIVQDLRKIGINARLETYSDDTAFAKCNDPAVKIAICSGLQFGAGAPDAWGPALDLATTAIGPNGCCNLGLVGVSTEDLRRLGYDGVEGTVNFDDDIRSCDALPLGDERVQCFVDIDVEASDLALGLPLLFPKQREIISDRVTNYTYDFYGYASLNTIALAQPSS